MNSNSFNHKDTEMSPLHLEWNPSQELSKLLNCEDLKTCSKAVNWEKLYDSFEGISKEDFNLKGYKDVGQVFFITCMRLLGRKFTDGISSAFDEQGDWEVSLTAYMIADLLTNGREIVMEENQFKRIFPTERLQTLVSESRHIVAVEDEEDLVQGFEEAFLAEIEGHTKKPEPTIKDVLDLLSNQSDRKEEILKAYLSIPVSLDNLVDDLLKVEKENQKELSELFDRLP